MYSSRCSLDHRAQHCQHTWLYSMAKGGVPTPLGCTRIVPARWPSQLKSLSQGCCLTATACKAQDRLGHRSHGVSCATKLPRIPPRARSDKQTAMLARLRCPCDMCTIIDESCQNCGDRVYRATGMDPTAGPLLRALASGQAEACSNSKHQCQHAYALQIATVCIRI